MGIKREPEGSGSIARIGLWLAFLVVGLSLPLTYLLQAPVPIGSGLLQVFGWGGLIGAAVGALIRTLCSPLFQARTWWSRGKVTAGCILLGALGGAGSGAWLDQLRVVHRQEVELPIVKLEKLPARRRTSGIQIATLSPLDPTGPDHIAAANIKGRYVREGYCLTGVVERGWLGGLWVRHFEARPCSKVRGSPGSHVIVAASDFSSWRWHQPRDFRPEREGQAWDDALPADLSCRVRPGAWLYRCSPR